MLQLAMERASPEKQQREVIENAYISRRVGRIKEVCYFNGIASDAWRLCLLLWPPLDLPMLWTKSIIFKLSYPSFHKNELQIAETSKAGWWKHQCGWVSTTTSNSRNAHITGKNLNCWLIKRFVLEYLNKHNSKEVGMSFVLFPRLFKVHLSDILP